MPVYVDKFCEVCGNVYTPTSPKQKYCVVCRDVAKRKRNREYDKKRSRIKNNYTLQTKTCPICGKSFDTYYKKKVYCGSIECEKERIRRKNNAMQVKRDKLSESVRHKEYYQTNRQKCLERKALSYRKTFNVDVPYVPRGFDSHTIDFVRKYFNKFGYTLLSKTYENNKEKLTVVCPEGHEWQTSFHNFKDTGNRCLHCYSLNNYTSRPERKLLDYFKNNYFQLEVIHNDRKQVGPLELDLYFPAHRVAVEVCGLYWHSEISGNKKRSYHYDKMMRCYDKNIRLLTVFEDEIRDKFDLVVSRILQALHLITNKVYARKCSVSVIDNKTANKFFRENHLQGSTQSIISWGLFYKTELLLACSIGRFVRKHAGDTQSVELKRFCSKSGFSIVGGFSKVFKQVLNYCRENDVHSIKSYCDMRYANIFKPVYEIAGFELCGFTKYTPHYVKSGKRYRNFSLRKTPQEQKIGKTEFELRLAQGYDRIWDCGHRTYVLNNI